MPDKAVHGMQEKTNSKDVSGVLEASEHVGSNSVYTGCPAVGQGKQQEQQLVQDAIAEAKSSLEGPGSWSSS